MASEIEFFFDYVSPYSYLADVQLKGLCERTGATIAYRPMLLGGVFKATGNVSPIFEKCEAKRAYGLKTLRRWVAMRGAPFQMNPHFPINSVALMRTAIAAQQAGVFGTTHAATFQAMWVDGKDLGNPEVIREVMDAAGVDGAALLAATQTDAIKQGLIAATEEAVRRGAFGVPTFCLGDEMFWGQDHIALLEARLTGKIPAIA